MRISDWSSDVCSSDLFKPVLIYSLLQSAQLIGDACDSFRSNCVDGIEADEGRIATMMRQSLMLVTALNPPIGYANAAQVDKQAYADKTTPQEAAVAPGLLTQAPSAEGVGGKEAVWSKG